MPYFLNFKAQNRLTIVFLNEGFGLMMLANKINTTLQKKKLKQSMKICVIDQILFSTLF
jgi:hypothetical protein